MGVIDKKIKRFLKQSVIKNHRSLLVILGSLGSQKISIIHQILFKLNKREIHTLWCSRDGQCCLDDNADCSWQLHIHNCAFCDMSDVLHQSFDLAILEDLNLSSLISFNFILPNIKGGGAIVLLFPDCTTLEDFKKLTLNENGHYSRFSKRFLQSFDSNTHCLILNSDLQILCSSKFIEKTDEMVQPSFKKIANIKSKCGEDSVMTSLLDLCLTEDQAKLLFKFLDVLKKRTFHSIVSVSSAYGRGKSAALGLAIAGSLALNYSNIFISSCNHNNVDVLFRFLLKGLDALQYKEDKDYDLIESTNPRFKNALIGLNVFKDYPQSVRFIFPDDVGHKLEQAELVVIDEAASIPYDKLKQLIGPYVVFMSSTTSGALSTSPYLHEDMSNNLQQIKSLKSSQIFPLSSGNSFETIILKEPIHYALDDFVESWNSHVFCLESSISPQLSFGCPDVQQCQLYNVSRDALFSGSSFSDRFLKSLVSIFNQSSLVVEPKDFVSLADSPGFKLFVLLPPLSKISKNSIPEVLCAVLVHLETKCPQDIVQSVSNLVEPVSNCFNDWNIEKNVTSFHGIHILNIATHPCYKRMKYGRRSIQLLQEFYEGKWISLEENISESDDCHQFLGEENSETESPLLIDLSKLKHERVEFSYVSFILSENIFSFWKKAGFVPLFLRTEKSSDSIVCFMMKPIAKEFESYIENNWVKFCNYYFTLLNSHCQNFNAEHALNILNAHKSFSNIRMLSKDEIDLYLKPYDMKRLEKYFNRSQDLNSITHIILVISKLYFKNLRKWESLSTAQEAVLLAYGLQNKSIDGISKDLDHSAITVIALLNRTLKKLTDFITKIIEQSVEKTLITPSVEMKPLTKDLNEELEEAANNINVATDNLQDLDVYQYAIKGSEDEWQKALHSGQKTLVSIKSIKKNVEIENDVSMKSEKKRKFNKNIKKRRK